MKMQARMATRWFEFVNVYLKLAELAGLPLPNFLEGTGMKLFLDDPKLACKSAAFSLWPRRILVTQESFDGLHHANRPLSLHILRRP
jgi:hypothetical protein